MLNINNVKGERGDELGEIKLPCDNVSVDGREVDMLDAMSLSMGERGGCARQKITSLSLRYRPCTLSAN